MTRNNSGYISEEQPMSDEMASGRSDISSIEKRRSVTAAEPAPTSGIRRAGAWFLHELGEILPPLIFFFVGFNPRLSGTFFAVQSARH
jgi:hypothetical protein